MNIFVAFYESQNALMLAVGIVSRNAIALLEGFASKSQTSFLDTVSTGSGSDLVSSYWVAGVVAHLANGCGVPERRGGERDGPGS